MHARPGNGVCGTARRIRSRLPGPAAQRRPGLRLSAPNSLRSASGSTCQPACLNRIPSSAGPGPCAWARGGRASASGAAGGGRPGASGAKLRVDSRLLVRRRSWRLGLGRRAICGASEATRSVGLRPLGAARPRLHLGWRTLALMDSSSLTELFLRPMFAYESGPDFGVFCNAVGLGP